MTSPTEQILLVDKKGGRIDLDAFVERLRSEPEQYWRQHAFAIRWRGRRKRREHSIFYSGHGSESQVRSRRQRNARQSIGQQARLPDSGRTKRPERGELDYWIVRQKEETVVGAIAISKSQCHTR